MRYYWQRIDEERKKARERYYRNKQNKDLIRKLIIDGHYLGAHSDHHLLYADWNKRDSTLVSQKEFEIDLRANYDVMRSFGIENLKARYFLPPYEWYNKRTVSWVGQMGLTTVNFTPGIRTNADYTTPDMANYRSSEQIMTDLKRFESSDPSNLNGTIILIHLGTSPQRTDKFYDHLDELLGFLTGKGYQFCRLDEKF